MLAILPLLSLILLSIIFPQEDYGWRKAILLALVCVGILIVANTKILSLVFPREILQAASTQNDSMVTFWLVYLVYYILLSFYYKNLMFKLQRLLWLVFKRWNFCW